jgi:hypothetical protein
MQCVGLTPHFGPLPACIRPRFRTQLSSSRRRCREIYQIFVERKLVPADAHGTALNWRERARTARPRGRLGDWSGVRERPGYTVHGVFRVWERTCPVRARVGGRPCGCMWRWGWNEHGNLATGSKHDRVGTYTQAGSLDFPTHSNISSSASENSVPSFRKKKCTTASIMVSLQVVATTAERRQWNKPVMILRYMR